MVAVVSPGEHVLVVEDDPTVREVVVRYLEHAGIVVTAVGDGESALSEAALRWPDLVVLDLMLPQIDGLEVCRRLRAVAPVAVIMLTARGDEDDRVMGLELGADDYVSKPFSPRELAARIKAILRRVEHRNDDEVLAAHDIVLRRDSRDVTVSGSMIELTGKEFDLLACFLEHPGIVLSREKLLDLVWGMTYPGGTRTVDVHVAQLRRKLGDPDTIRTVRGSGYKLLSTAA
jgi:DNA-binding response OmpR family regulator